MKELYYNRQFAHNVPDFEEFVSPLTGTSKWWKSLNTFTDPSIKNIRQWFIKYKNNTPPENTIKSCPGILDLFKRSYLVKWPCEVLLETSIDNDGSPKWRWNIPDPILSFNSHSLKQWQSSVQIYKNKFNLKIELPYLLGASKPVSLMYLPPSYHTSEVEYDVMPGIITLNKKVTNDFNINLMLPIEEKVYHFKTGQPLVYITLLNESQTLKFKENKNTVIWPRVNFMNAYKRIKEE